MVVCGHNGYTEICQLQSVPHGHAHLSFGIKYRVSIIIESVYMVQTRLQIMIDRTLQIYEEFEQLLMELLIREC